MNNNDDWMNDPIEMDDWINSLEEETKNIPRKTGGNGYYGSSGPSGGNFDGMGGGRLLLLVIGVIVGVVILIAIVVTIINTSTSSSRSVNTGTVRTTSQKCAIEGCDNLRQSGEGYRYCYSHTCIIIGCKNKVVGDDIYCSKHKAQKSNTTETSEDSSKNNSYSKKNNSDPYDANQYDDPDYFFDDWGEDFEDYDEAEQYWDEHH